MSFINCDLNCIYQTDGYCHLDSVNAVHIATQSPCMYYQQKKKRKRPVKTEQAHDLDFADQGVN